MTAYRAKFADGSTVSLKNSTKTFTHAWRVTSDGDRPTKGWASSEQLARAAAQSIVTARTVKPSRGDWGRYWKNREFVAAANCVAEIVRAEVVA